MNTSDKRQAWKMTHPYQLSADRYEYIGDEVKAVYAKFWVNHYFHSSNWLEREFGTGEIYNHFLNLGDPEFITKYKKGTCETSYEAPPACDDNFIPREQLY